MTELIRTTYTLRGTFFSRVDTGPVARAFYAWFRRTYPAVDIQQERVR